MLSNDVAVRAFYGARVLLEVLREEVRKAALANETNTRAVFFGGSTKFMFFRYFTNLDLFHFSDWKEGVCQGFMVYLMQEIALIFALVTPFDKRGSFFAYPCLYIMTGRDFVCSE